MTEKQLLHIERLAALRRGQKLTWKTCTAHTQETKELISAKLKGKLKGRKRNPNSVLKGAEKRKRGNYFYCLECGNKFWRQPSAIKKGQNKFCSKNCYQQWQIGKSKLSGFKLNPKKGKDNPNWKGGKTKEAIIIRNSHELTKVRNNGKYKVA